MGGCCIIKICHHWHKCGANLPGRGRWNGTGGRKRKTRRYEEDVESEEELGECESEAERQVRSVKSVSNFVTRVGGGSDSGDEEWGMLAATPLIWDRKPVWHPSLRCLTRYPLVSSMFHFYIPHLRRQKSDCWLFRKIGIYHCRTTYVLLVCWTTNICKLEERRRRAGFFSRDYWSLVERRESLDH